MFDCSTNCVAVGFATIAYAIALSVPCHVFITLIVCCISSAARPRPIPHVRKEVMLNPLGIKYMVVLFAI